MLLRIEGVTKHFSGDYAAVDRLNIEVEKGHIVTLLGPSGCGKTTILRLIAGFELPDTGNIFIEGNAVSTSDQYIPPDKRGIGMVFQDYALFPHMTVCENAAFPLRKHLGVNIEVRVKEILEMVGLQEYKKRYPHQLSGGQQQRVALARALITHPKLILLDEPFSNLDADLRNHMREEIRQIIQKTGTTAIIVSHDQRDALAMSDKIAVIRAGKLQQYGTPYEIYQHPANRFTAEYIGKSNIIPGVVSNKQFEVDTFLGTIPCCPTHQLPPGSKVEISIRPESVKLDSHGLIKGRLVSSVYVGNAIEAVVAINSATREELHLRVQLHPEIRVETGQILSFKVVPDFVAVIA